MKVLRAGSTVDAVGASLIPIEWLEVTSHQEGGHVWLQANKEAVAVVLCDAKGDMRLLDMNGEPQSLEEWLPRVEGLEAALKACRSQ